LALGRTLGSHRIRDGELLHLVPRRTEWPELEYDDLVDAVAGGSGRLGAAWSSWHTRTAGLVLGAVTALLGPVAVVRAGPPAGGESWGATAWWVLLVAAVLLVTGVLLARAVGDSGAGALAGVLALPYAVLGGALLTAGDRPLTALGSPHLMTASAAVLL